MIIKCMNKCMNKSKSILRIRDKCIRAMNKWMYPFVTILISLLSLWSKNYFDQMAKRDSCPERNILTYWFDGKSYLGIRQLPIHLVLLLCYIWPDACGKRIYNLIDKIIDMPSGRSNIN